jgi:hypothetical protein
VNYDMFRVLTADELSSLSCKLHVASDGRYRLSLDYMYITCWWIMVRPLWICSSMSTNFDTSMSCV